jgi:hypothetical protein
MGKQLDLLRKLIKEELEIALTEDDLTTPNPGNTGNDDFYLEESEELNEAAMYDIVNYLTDGELTEDLDEAKGKPTTKLIIKQSKTKEEIVDFLEKVRKSMGDKNNRTGMFKNYKGRGRKSDLFSNEDIKMLADIISNPEGFDAMEIATNVPYYANKKNPRNSAQKLMDVMQNEKSTSEGKNIGKGYIEVLDSAESKKAPEDKEVVNTDTEEVDADEFEDATDGKIDGKFDDEEAGLEISDEFEGGSELAQLRKEKDRILATYKSNLALGDEYKSEDYADPLEQYKDEIGDIPSQIKALQNKVDAYLNVEDDDVEYDDEDEMINESLVHMFQKRAGLLNG